MSLFRKIRDAFSPRPAPTSSVTPPTSSHAEQHLGIGEYRNLYANQSDAAPGWDAIDRALAALYRETEPWHWGTVIKHAMGGPDPIDGVSAYSSNAGGVPHFHFCTYGFTSLYYDEAAVGQDFSGYGFELTFRLKNNGGQRDELVWVCNLLQNLGRYVFGSGNWFEVNQWIPANGPINVDYPTDIVALAFVADPLLPATESANGRIEFLQLVGLTNSEMEDIKVKRRTCEEVVNALRRNNPLLITDLDRCD